MKTIFYISREPTPFFLSIKRVLEEYNIMFLHKDLSQSLFYEKLQNNSVSDTIIIIDAYDDLSSVTSEWLWMRIRLNDKNIGSEYAGTPFIVFGFSKGFKNSSDGAVFRYRQRHHSYLPKPTSLRIFIQKVNLAIPVDRSDLPDILKFAPDSIEETLQDSHRLGRLYNNEWKKNLLSMSDIDIRGEIEKKEIELYNLEALEKNFKTIEKFKIRIDKLKNEIIQKRGDIWKKY